MIIHVGAPKTASTYLQKHVFPAWVLTSEKLMGRMHKGFSGFDKKLVELKSAFPEAEILFITRDEEDWKRSAYTQYVFMGGKMGKKRYLGQFENLDWNNYINKYKQAFPRVHVLSYELLRDDLKEFEKRLSDILGERIECPPVTENKSVSGWRLKVGLLINRTLHPALKRVRPDITEWLIRPR